MELGSCAELTTEHVLRQVKPLDARPQCHTQACRHHQPVAGGYGGMPSPTSIQSLRLARCRGNPLPSSGRTPVYSVRGVPGRRIHSMWFFRATGISVSVCASSSIGSRRCSANWILPDRFRSERNERLSHCSYLEGLRSHHSLKLDALFAARFYRSRRLHDSLHRRYKEHDNGKTHWLP